MKRLNSKFLMLMIASLGVVYISGCEDVLEPKVYENLTPETFFSSEADMNNAVAALYNPFITDWGTTDQGAGTWYVALYNADPTSYLYRSEITTDIMFSQWDPTYTNFTWGPATLTLNNDQASTYAKIRYVARATDVIDKIEKSQADVPETVKDRYVAEAKTLRAWLMYILYDFFGPVNVKLDPATLSDNEVTPRLSHDEYVSAIEQDLNDAIPFLADSYNNSPENWGRVTKGTARMLLLRLYMHEKDWASAEATAREVMNMGYSLMDNYEDVFNIERNNEIIHAIPADGASPNYYVTENLYPDFRRSVDGKVVDGNGGWETLWMNWDFYDTYAENDERLNTIFDSYINSSGETVTREDGIPGAMAVKYTGVEGDGPGYPTDHPVFRYAEVLMSLAEAINEQEGPTAEALDYANQVRNRAGLPDWEGLTQSQFRDSLLAERGREFYAEGLRRQDLIRYGKFIEYAQSRSYSSGAQPHMVLFPIPESVIIEGDGIIEQNPGY